LWTASGELTSGLELLARLTVSVKDLLNWPDEPIARHLCHRFVQTISDQGLASLATDPA